MDLQRRTPTGQRAPSHAQPVHEPHLITSGDLPGRRAGRVSLSIGMLLTGVIVGVIAVLLFVLFIADGGRALIVPASPRSGSIVVQASTTYITQLVRKRLKTSSLPGNISSVQVILTQNSPITITGDDTLSILGISVTKHFTLLLQPFVRSCQLQVHILHADLAGIPVTDFVAQFEDQINQQLHMKSSSLPEGFVYCATSVRTSTQGLFITYSATPV